MSIEKLQNYLPENTLSYIEKLLIKQNILIKITNTRQTRLGSFRATSKKQQHVINITGSLNPYSFLLTLVHEIAHLKVWELYKRSAKPHGAEWKNIFTNLMTPLILANVFPKDIEKPLSRHMQNPKASTTADSSLAKALKKYDNNNSELLLLEDISENSQFLWRGNRVFVKREKLRKRYKCVEINTEKVYLFSPLAEVELLEDEMVI